jgi:hypothetical protein
MRMFSDSSLNETASSMMYEIVNQYIDFYNKKKFTSFLKITLYDEVEMYITWGMKKYLNTRYYWVNDYEPNEDDIYLLNQLAIYFQPKTILDIIKWYHKVSKAHQISS